MIFLQLLFLHALPSTALNINRVSDGPPPGIVGGKALSFRSVGSHNSMSAPLEGLNKVQRGQMANSKKTQNGMNQERTKGKTAWNNCVIPIKNTLSVIKFRALWPNNIGVHEKLMKKVDPKSREHWASVGVDGWVELKSWSKLISLLKLNDDCCYSRSML